MTTYAPAPTIGEVDLGQAGGSLCHTMNLKETNTLCGIGFNNSKPIHDWIETIDGTCPTCKKKSCPTCDLISDIYYETH